MPTIDQISCSDFPCETLQHDRFTVPAPILDIGAIRGLMVAETPALDPADDFAAGPDSFFMGTTLQAFASAGFPVTSMLEIEKLGVHLTTAVKCAKTDYAVPTESIRACSHLLELEMQLFPNLEVILAMGDVAIRAINEIGRRVNGKRVIPAGSTYKLREGEYYLGKIRVLPSYLQTGRSFLIEKSKQKMIAQDIRNALTLLGHAAVSSGD